MTSGSSHMVFALDQELKPAHTEQSESTEDCNYVTMCALDLWRPQTQFERRVLNSVEAAEHLQDAPKEGFCIQCHLASTLVASGYRCSIQEALGGGRGCASFENLRHEYLIVSNGFETVVVDPHFQSQFSVVAPTARYSAALQIPEHFVGSLSRLAALVSFLCREMAASFRVTRFTLPPWRQRRAMLSKWQPVRALTHRVLPESSGDLLMSTHCTPKTMCTDGAPKCGRPTLSTVHDMHKIAKSSDSEDTQETPAATNSQQLTLPATPIAIESRCKYGREYPIPEMGSKDQCTGGNRCSSCKIWQQLTGERMCGIFPPIRTVRMQGKPLT